MTDSSPLPGVLEEIADVAGRPTAIAMALAWGGREVHIPKPRHLARHPDHPLARLLEAEGDGAAGLGLSRRLQRLSAAGAPCLRRALAAAGATAVEIASRLSLSPSAARRYIRACRRRLPEGAPRMSAMLESQPVQRCTLVAS